MPASIPGFPFFRGTDNGTDDDPGNFFSHSAFRVKGNIIGLR
jgi:hypothetical protein